VVVGAMLVVVVDGAAVMDVLVEDACVVVTGGVVLVVAVVAEVAGAGEVMDPSVPTAQAAAATAQASHSAVTPVRGPVGPLMSTIPASRRRVPRPQGHACRRRARRFCPPLPGRLPPGPSRAAPAARTEVGPRCRPPRRAIQGSMVRLPDREGYMNRRTFRFVVLLVLVFGVLASACFAIRGLSMTKDSLAPGERSAVRFELKPYAAGALQTSDKVFVLIGSNNADRKGKVMFDTLANWGGPYEGKLTAGFTNALLRPGACTAYGISASDFESDFDTWEAWHTRVEIDGTGLTPADFSSLLRATLTVERPPGTANGESAEFVVFSGGWNDANDSNTYNAGEDLVCTGVVIFSIPFVG
jgi:hypothetical protein